MLPCKPPFPTSTWGGTRCGRREGEESRCHKDGLIRASSLLSRPSLSLEERVTKTSTETEGQSRDEGGRKALETALRRRCCRHSHPGTTPPPRSRCLRSPRPELAWPASSLLPRGHRFQTDAFLGSALLPVSKRTERVRGGLTLEPDFSFYIDFSVKKRHRVPMGLST